MIPASDSLNASENSVSAPLVSIITPVFERVDVISDCLESVRRQTYSRIEHIVVDGGSRDGTVELLRGRGDVAQIVSEPDEGLYDAINKGLKLASGEVVGVLNSDDFLAGPRVIEAMVAELESASLEAVFADVEFIVGEGDDCRVFRRYSSRKAMTRGVAKGFMPAHPSLYVRSGLYSELGPYRTEYEIAADYEFLVRLFLKRGVRASYLPQTAVFMRGGGASNGSVKKRARLNSEVHQSFADNGIRIPRLRLLLRYAVKVAEYAAPIAGKFPHEGRQGDRIYWFRGTG